MPSDQTEYELFLSYARLDNRPIPETYPHGWVTALHDHILADQRRYSTEPLRIFFDTHEIKDMDDWRHRILGGLRSSKILLVCLSPNYFKSQPCRWEWDEYLKRQTHQLLGSDSVATVYFVEVPGSDEHDNARRLTELLRGNFTDLRPWFPAGPRMMQEEEVRRRMDALGLSLWERIERARRARTVPGNVRRTNPFFVGRREELRRLHEQLGVGAIGVVTAVHGLGGQGKTELAYHYANGFADCYRCGVWSLGAEGKKELLPLIGELAFVPRFGYSPSDAEKADATLLGQGVLEEMRKRCTQTAEADRQPGASVLLILDNVSEPELLSVGQLALLPHPANWLRLVATTRLGPERLAKSGKQLATVAVDSLDEEDAVTLIREHQPNQQFPNEAEALAAREIVRDLGGFTLAVEQVAIALGLSAAEEPPSAFLKRLRTEGLPSVDDLPRDADVAAQMLHQHKQLAPILRSTLEPLVKELPAAGTALQLAALLPPDSVPWPWLKELTVRHHAELADRPAEWARIKRRLEGSRLLTSGDGPEIARMHRLVAAHLNPSLGAQPFLDLRVELCAYLGQRADSISRTQAAPAVWELDALLVALPHLLNEHSTRLFLNHTMFLDEKVLAYRTIPAARSLLTRTNLLLQRLAESDPGNAAWQRDLSVAFNKLGDLAVAQGNLPEAQRLFAESLRIRQRLAESDPGNAAWQFDIGISNERLGDLAVAQGELERAKGYYSKRFTIIQRLAESDPGNAEWQRDLSVSLNKLGDLAVAQGNLPEVQRLFAESLRIHQRLADSDPGNADWQRDLSVSFQRASWRPGSGARGVGEGERALQQTFCDHPTPG